MIKATQASERQPYDVVRSALKEVELDSSRRVELDDYVDVRLIGDTLAIWRRKCALNHKLTGLRSSSSPRSAASTQRQPRTISQVAEFEA